jgi:hypothetical protein
VATNNKQCSITNNSGKDIALLTIVPAGETGSSNAIPIAGGSLEVLKTTDGNTFIKNSSSGSVTLDHSFGDGGPVQNYDLIISDSTWLYPVGLLAVSQQTDASYPSQTITQDGGTAMAQAELFYQTIAAYPGSQLCQDYVAALQAAKDAAEAKADGSPHSASAAASAIDNALQSFFKGTTSYSRVTLAHLAAVDAYHKQLPFAWARYKNSFTYYLYGTDDTSSLFVGTLSLQKTGAIDVTKRNGGYTCQFVPAVNPADISKTDVDHSRGTTLTYTNNLFVDNSGVANPKIAIRGSYLLNRLLTMNGDDNAIVTIASGSANGVTCIGLDSPQKSNVPAKPAAVSAASTVSDEAVKYWDQLTHPKNMADWVLCIATFISPVVLIPGLAYIVYSIYKLNKHKIARNEPLAKNEIEEIITTVNDELAVTRIKWARGTAVIPEYGLERLKTAVDLEAAAGLNQALASGLAAQKYTVQELMEYAAALDGKSLGKLQSLIGDIQKSAFTVKDLINAQFILNPNADALLEGRVAVLENEFQKFAQNQPDIEEIYKKVNKDLSDDTRAGIDEAMSRASWTFDNLKKTQHEDEANKEDMDPKSKERVEPELV